LLRITPSGFPSPLGLRYNSQPLGSIGIHPTLPPHIAAITFPSNFNPASIYRIPPVIYHDTSEMNYLIPHAEVFVGLEPDSQIQTGRA
jgi:hypothetical protein